MRKETIKLILIYAIVPALILATFLTIYFTQRKNVEIDFPTTLAVAEENFTVKFANPFLYEGEVTLTIDENEEIKTINNAFNVYFNLPVKVNKTVEIKINITKGNELNNPFVPQLIFSAKVETANGKLYGNTNVTQDIQFVGEVIAIRTFEIKFVEPIVIRIY